MKYHIEKNTVQETLVIPLYGRKMCSELYPNLFRDETAMRLIEEIDYDFSTLAKRSQSMMQQFGFLECAMRQSDLACEVRDYLRSHPNAAVVNLGCGLDATGHVCDNGTCKIYNIDFPDVIAVRDALLPAGEREKNIPCNLNDTSWFSEIDASGGAVFFAAGVFYYFLTPQVKALVCAMAEAFPGGKLVFDAANRKAVKLMLKTWLKDAEIKDVGAYFAVTDARHELSLGLFGVVLEGLACFGVYRLMAAKSPKYAHRYRSGIFGYLMFCACGFHVPVCAAVFLMKHGLSEALLTQYSAYFLMPLLVLFWIFFFVLVMTQIVAFRKGLTPYLKWCCVFSMAFGMLVYFLAALLGNRPLGNALRCAWLAIGNVWMFGGLLVTMKKAQRA